LYYCRQIIVPSFCKHLFLFFSLVALGVKIFFQVFRDRFRRKGLFAAWTFGIKQISFKFSDLVTLITFRAFLILIRQCIIDIIALLNLLFNQVSLVVIELIYLFWCEIMFLPKDINEINACTECFNILDFKEASVCPFITFRVQES
jgi:hypothetical protein